MSVISLIDGVSDRRLFRTDVPIPSVVGTGERPFILPWVHRFPRGGFIFLPVVNDELFLAINVHVVLSGYKLIPPERL